MRTIRIQIGKKYCDLETSRKSLKNNILDQCKVSFLFKKNISIKTQLKKRQKHK